MNEREQKQQPLEYAGPTRRGFPGGWRGWALALAIMVGVAVVLLLMVFAFSRIVLLTGRSV
ncbi:MAG TPA: hypothetical protein VIM11_04455 [Tepidisphaeraceae bacterium]|jgi:uncharacterized membrane protein